MRAMKHLPDYFDASCVRARREGAALAMVILLLVLAVIA